MNTKKQLLLICSLAISAILYGHSAESGKVITFRFVPGEDQFYIPWEGNGEQLVSLYSFIDEYREEITSGRMPVYVDGYSASMKSRQENMHLAFVRANRVKSELITHKGLVEDNFVTRNFAEDYQGYKDVVVVTLRVPAKTVPEPKPEPKVEPRSEPEPEPVVEPKPEPQPEPQALPSAPAVPAKPYAVAIRTNLLYDAFLMPTLGIEWRVNRSVGIKVDGSLAWWGDEKGKIQRTWLVSPEVRWYMAPKKRFYLGVGGNYGEYNTYGYLLGKLWPHNTGYQGKLWNAGLTVGYQLYLSRSFSLDFNLGLGYSSFEYNSFNIIDEVRVYKERDTNNTFWGPTQAGVNLVWTIGGNK